MDEIKKQRDMLKKIKFNFVLFIKLNLELTVKEKKQLMIKTDNPKNELNIGLILISSKKFIYFFLHDRCGFIDSIDYHLTNQLVLYDHIISRCDYLESKFIKYKIKMLKKHNCLIRLYEKL